jgi:glycosyltransferase involved in cell wall biosynthesis
MKGYPRRSEPFISNEIYLLERMGLPIHVFALKGFSDDRDYPPVNQIQADVTYVPENLEVDNRSLIVWLVKNLPRYVPSHVRLFIRNPVAYLETLFYAVFLSVRYCIREGEHFRWPWLRRVFCKDFLRAGFIALRIRESTGIRHLHGHFCHGSTTMTMFVAMLCKLPFSFTAHAKDIYLERLNPDDLLQRKMRRAKFVVTCTDFNRRHLQSKNGSKSPVHTIYHGLDAKWFAPPQAPRANDPPTILSVGRFVEKKGFPFLIKACRLLKAKRIPFRCRIVGSADTDSPVVEKLIREYGLEADVTIGPAVSQDELRAIYQLSDIFVLPCLVAADGDRDGIPNVLAEAMATEMAIVSTRVSGIPELVEDGSNGLLAPNGF